MAWYVVRDQCGGVFWLVQKATCKLINNWTISLFKSCHVVQFPLLLLFTFEPPDWGFLTALLQPVGICAAGWGWFFTLSVWNRLWLFKNFGLERVTNLECTVTEVWRKWEIGSEVHCTFFLVHIYRNCRKLKPKGCVKVCRSECRPAVLNGSKVQWRWRLEWN